MLNKHTCGIKAIEHKKIIYANQQGYFANKRLAQVGKEGNIEKAY